MWRFVARGIRTIFERKLACHTNVYSRLLQDKNNEIKMVSIHEQKSLRVLITHVKSFYESTKNADANNQSNSNWNANHTWTEAVGWVIISDKLLGGLKRCVQASNMICFFSPVS